MAIVTGSGLGIGRAVATVLAQAGAKARLRPWEEHAVEEHRSRDS